MFSGPESSDDLPVAASVLHQKEVCCWGSFRLPAAWGLLPLLLHIGPVRDSDFRLCCRNTLPRPQQLQQRDAAPWQLVEFPWCLSHLSCLGGSIAGPFESPAVDRASWSADLNLRLRISTRGVFRSPGLESRVQVFRGLRRLCLDPPQHRSTPPR